MSIIPFQLLTVVVPTDLLFFMVTTMFTSLLQLAMFGEVGPMSLLILRESYLPGILTEILFGL